MLKTSLICLLAFFGLTGMSCSVGTRLNPTGTGHQAYEEHWANGSMTDCKLTNDSGIEAAGITTSWHPCGREFGTTVTGLAAFQGQAIGAAEADAAQRNFTAGLQAGAAVAGPYIAAACSVGSAAAGVPVLAALCGLPPVPKKPKPVPAPLPAPPAPARTPSALLVPGHQAGVLWPPLQLMMFEDSEP